MTIGAYILIAASVAVWAFAMPAAARIPMSVMRGITVFGSAFLLAVCCLELLPEVASASEVGIAPFVAILVGFLLQQILDGLSAHAEHGHTEDGFTLGGLMTGLCLHAFLEGMPLVWEGKLASGLMWGIVIHNIPVALIVVSLAASKGYGMWRTLALLLLFGVMSPLGSMASVGIMQPDARWHGILTGMVVGVLLHVSSSILFDHKRAHFSWINIGLMVVAFVAAAFITN